MYSHFSFHISICIFSNYFECYTFYSCFVSDRAFRVGEACTGCGSCARRCPVNNILLYDGKPVWCGSCTHCMACICYCPTEAIEYGRKSRGKPRYHFEAL